MSAEARSVITLSALWRRETASRAGSSSPTPSWSVPQRSFFGPCVQALWLEALAAKHRGLGKTQRGCSPSGGGQPRVFILASEAGWLEDVQEACTVAAREGGGVGSIVNIDRDLGVPREVFLVSHNAQRDSGEGASLVREVVIAEHPD